MANDIRPKQFHSWKPEPLTRGSFGLLSSCLITLFLCVWTAVHLNVPEHNKPGSQMWRRVACLVVAIFAPEIIVLVAYGESKDADEIENFMRKALSLPKPPSWWKMLPTKLKSKNAWSALNRKTWRRINIRKAIRHVRWLCSRHALYPDTDIPLLPLGVHEEDKPYAQTREWSRIHSLYAAMGGFAIDYSNDARQCHNVPSRLTLRPEGLRILAENYPEAIPCISASEIMDKSKGDGLAKTLACAQALWFCLGLITRRVAGLSISLLELNTAVHAACSLATYLIFWWNKPLNVEEPTLIPAGNIPSLSALAVLAYHRPYLKWVPGNLKKGKSNLRLRYGQSSYGFRYEKRYLGELISGAYDLPPELVITPAEAEIWELAQEALHGTKSLKLHIDVFAGSRTRNRLKQRRIIPSIDGREDFIDRFVDIRDPIFTALIVAGFFYGGAHLLVWNHNFRGPTEALLWKMSGIYLASSGFVFTLNAVLIDLFLRWESSHSQSFTRDFCISLPLQLLNYFLGVNIPFYIVCRFYIVVESFLDVTHLPDSAFMIPRWSQYFPHL